MSRFEDNLINSKWFIRAQKKNSRSKDFVKMLIKKEAEVIVSAPQEGLAKAIEKGSVQIQVLIDALNTQRALQIEAYINNILSQTISQYIGQKPAANINVSLRILYNPSMKSAYFMIPALMGLILCILTVLITCMSLSKEKEFGTFEKLLFSPASVIEILLGKTLPYISIGFIVLPLMLATGIILFDLPAAGILKIFFVCLIFIISSCSVAVFISTIAKNQSQAMMASFLFLLPSILLSGMLFPVENIPIYIRWAAYINPIYYLLTLLRNIILKGGDLIFIFQNVLPLAAIGAILAFASIKKFNSKLD
jgi:ABC-2 type transport system permease protein